MVLDHGDCVIKSRVPTEHRPGGSRKHVNTLQARVAVHGEDAGEVADVVEGVQIGEHVILLNDDAGNMVAEVRAVPHAVEPAEPTDIGELVQRVDQNGAADLFEPFKSAGEMLGEQSTGDRRRRGRVRAARGFRPGRGGQPLAAGMVDSNG